MRIPPFYRLPSWQRFFAGMVVGGIISWMIFLFMFGTMHEKQALKIEEQKNDISKLKNTLSYLQEEYKQLNQENENELVIQEVKIKIINTTKTKVELLGIHETEDKLSEDLRSLLTKDLETVYGNKELIKKIIENKTVKLNDKNFRLKVKEMYFFTTTQITLELKYEED
ncbi:MULTISPECIES: sporulation membrane protein YtrI [Bacillaceae]|uniref:sporulation membrane protein YtrI n=1 Tax=Bacillaceae TaxID=186817 RepID=UPI001C58A512|nr:MULTISPECIES: sporulation membrane protein YtrI [Rossellomorea]MBW3111734.1 sporulation protein [Bacillus sp. MCCB 382]MDX8342128.1 sporulation protein [Rossellomorea sp. YZS02]